MASKHRVIEMSKKPYWMLFVYDRDQKDWFDVCGSYNKQETKDEIDFCGYIKRDCVILDTKGTLQGLLDARKKLPKRN